MKIFNRYHQIKRENPRRQNQRLLWLFIDNYRIKVALDNLYKDGSILDVGCGDSIEFMQGIDRYCGIDLDEELLNYLSRKYNKLQFLVFDLEGDDQILDRKFDFILLLATIEHIENPTILLKFCKKHLQKNGKLIITTPTKLGDILHDFLKKLFGTKIKTFEMRPHVKIYDYESLKSVVESVGLSVEKYKKFQFGMNQLLVAKND